MRTKATIDIFRCRIRELFLRGCLFSKWYGLCLTCQHSIWFACLNKKEQVGENVELLRCWGWWEKVPSSQLRSFFSSSTPSFSNCARFVSISISSFSICSTRILGDFTWYKNKRTYESRSSKDSFNLKILTLGNLNVKKVVHFLFFLLGM